MLAFGNVVVRLRMPYEIHALAPMSVQITNVRARAHTEIRAFVCAIHMLARKHMHLRAHIHTKHTVRVCVSRIHMYMRMHIHAHHALAPTLTQNQTNASTTARTHAHIHTGAPETSKIQAPVHDNMPIHPANLVRMRGYHAA